MLETVQVCLNILLQARGIRKGSEYRTRHEIRKRVLQYTIHSLSAILCTVTGLHAQLRFQVLTKNVKMKILYDGIPCKSEMGTEVSYEFAASTLKME